MTSLPSTQQNGKLNKLSKTTRVLFVLALVVAGGLLWQWQQHRPRRPKITNVVLISIDTCRADHLSCYGHSRRTTPNIDRLAARGARFTRAQTTNPITLPSHCSMMTGTLPPAHNVHLNLDRLDDARNQTLAEVLRDHGFQTGAMIGAFPLSAHFGLDQGFDTFDEDFGNASGRGVMNQRDASAVTAAAINWIDQTGDKPFFLFAHYFDPHRPSRPPDPYLTLYRDDLYSGEIAYTDHEIGQLLDHLSSRGLLDSTLIVLTSDHGESLGEHGEDTHAFFAYQSTIHVPLIIAGPGIQGGQHWNEGVSVIDIVPTVLGLLDLPVPSNVQGVDLTPALVSDAAPPPDRFLYSESWYPAKFDCSPLLGLVHNHWHYLSTTQPELYDLDADPQETNNVIAHSPEVRRLLDTELRNILTQRTHLAGSGSRKTEQEAAKQLQSLGYVGGRPDTSTIPLDTHLEDPKDYFPTYRKYMKAQSAWAKRHMDQARMLCAEILAERPKALHARFLLAHVAREQGHHAEALDQYSNVLAIAAKEENSAPLNYEVYQAHNNLAWILAITANDQLHDGALALKHAKQANQLSGGRNADVLDTLAVAYAAAGEFDHAIETAEKALSLSSKNGRSQAAIREHLELFRQSIPYREGDASPEKDAAGN